MDYPSWSEPQLAAPCPWKFEWNGNSNSLAPGSLSHHALPWVPASSGSWATFYGSGRIPSFNRLCSKKDIFGRRVHTGYPSSSGQQTQFESAPCPTSSRYLDRVTIAGQARQCQLHQLLVGGWCCHETKQHSGKLKQAILGSDCHHGNVSLPWALHYIQIRCPWWRTFFNLPLHHDNLVPSALGMCHCRSWHSTFGNLHMAWFCYPFSLLTELVRPMVRLGVILSLVHGAWQRFHDPHLQMPSVNDWLGALGALHNLYQCVYSTMFVLPRSFSFWENTTWCLRSSQWITVFSSSDITSSVPLYSTVRCSGSGAKGSWIFWANELSSPSVTLLALFGSADLSQQLPSCCWELSLSLGFWHLKMVLTLLHWHCLSHQRILSNDHWITMWVKHTEWHHCANGHIHHQRSQDTAVPSGRLGCISTSNLLSSSPSW